MITALVVLFRGDEMNEQGVLLIQEYGRVELRLRELMDQRGISRNRMARLVNTRYEVIDKWYKNQVEKIDADILARICFVLRCGVGDLLVYRERQRPRSRAHKNRKMAHPEKNRLTCVRGCDIISAVEKGVV